MRNKIPDVARYNALISQTGTADPTVKVLQNTIPEGDITWTRTDVGVYQGELTGAFKMFRTQFWVAPTTQRITFRPDTNDNEGNEDKVELITYFDGVAADDCLLTTAIKIEIYKKV